MDTKYSQLMDVYSKGRKYEQECINVLLRFVNQLKSSLGWPQEDPSRPPVSSVPGAPAPPAVALQNPHRSFISFCNIKNLEDGERHALRNSLYAINSNGALRAEIAVELSANDPASLFVIPAGAERTDGGWVVKFGPVGAIMKEDGTAPVDSIDAAAVHLATLVSSRFPSPGTP